MTTSLVEHDEVRSAIDLLEAWIEAQRVYRELPGLAMGIVHDQTFPPSTRSARGCRRRSARCRRRPAGSIPTSGPRWPVKWSPPWPGRRMVFEVDAAGRVTRVRFGENYTERIASWEDR